jgi:hypothetical protein
LELKKIDSREGLGFEAQEDRYHRGLRVWSEDG